MSEIGLDAYWEFYREQSKILINSGIEIKEIGAKKAYINNLWKEEKEKRQKFIRSTEKIRILNKKIKEAEKREQVLLTKINDALRDHANAQDKAF
jgi:hypothetical protein